MKAEHELKAKMNGSKSEYERFKRMRRSENADATSWRVTKTNLCKLRQSDRRVDIDIRKYSKLVLLIKRSHTRKRSIKIIYALQDCSMFVIIRL